MSALCSDLREKNPYYLPLLLLISIVSHFPFVLNGFGEIDATKIAVSVIDMLNNGPDAAFANFYFSDVIPLYVLYLKWFMKLLNYNYAYLPVVMNYTNAIFGTLTIIPAFFLIRRLFGNPSIAFCTVLALIFTPSFYQSTIMGFPHLLAFFFLLISLNLYLLGLDHSQKSTVYFLMFLSCIFLTIAFLFKSDYVLAAGVYIGFLFIRKVRDKGKITSAFIIILLSGVLFLLFRNLILGPTSGTTMSKEGMSKWYNFSLILPSTIGYFIAQAKPIAYGAGIATFCIGGISFIFYLFKRRFDIITFIVSWAAVPTLVWLIMIGNNARHNMITTLPLLAIIVIFFYEKAPKYVIALTVMLILGNFLVTSPSFSILTPSGNLFKSSTLLNNRIIMFQSRAKEVANTDEDKIVVLGTFHNPHVVFELIRSGHSYKAVKIGRENYILKIGSKEYVFIYFVVIKPEDLEEGIDEILSEYHLQNHVFVSATYDLKTLDNRGIKTRTLKIIERSSL
jgi:hypothetical protein